MLMPDSLSFRLGVVVNLYFPGLWNSVKLWCFSGNDDGSKNDNGGNIDDNNKYNDNDGNCH